MYIYIDTYVILYILTYVYVCFIKCLSKMAYVEATFPDRPTNSSDSLLQTKTGFDQTRFRPVANSLKLVAPLIAREAGELTFFVGKRAE